MKEISIVGVGIRGFKQVTLETLDEIKSADRVFHLTLFDEELHEINPNTENLTEAYTKSVSPKIYDEQTSKVISALEEANVQKICVVFYGHPTYLVTTTQSLIREGEAKGAKVRVFPGISSLDVIWTVLNQDSGIAYQLLEPYSLAEQAAKINPAIDLFIPQATEYKVPFLRKEKILDHPQGINEIREILLRHYPDTHECAFLFCSPLPHLKDEIIVVPLTNLNHNEHMEKYLRGMTLFVPKIGMKT